MAACVACQSPLFLEIGPDSEDEDVQMGGSSSGKAAAAPPQMVPDDLHLNCGCHFHWQCLLEGYQVTECPHCGSNISTTLPDGTPQVLCTLHNEGGVQENLDILPLLTEESYLKAYPEDRKCRAFLEFCREGDIKAIIDMLQEDSDDDSEEEEEEVRVDGDDMRDRKEEERIIGPEEMLRYQDPIGDMQSALHAAVQGGSREVAWLLLLLASNLDLTQFPPEVFQEAEALGIMRGDLEGKTDIRGLKDVNGKSAEDFAREIGGVWVGWEGTGRLTI